MVGNDAGGEVEDDMVAAGVNDHLIGKQSASFFIQELTIRLSHA